ncbi:MAG TPA: metallophosphoesterase family protein [Candidatus Goldiibacteriota bacterium]|nr:metallophosphoesterase family protein [Candidatus Goldiibacteriota bacterium]
MRYAVISDVHSNYEALKAVLDYLKSNPVDTIVCLGDITGYGASPRECIAEIRAQKNMVCLAGDHDLAACGNGAEHLSREAKMALEINKGMLLKEDTDYLASLKSSYHGDSELFVHASPRDNVNEYLFLVEKFQENMRFFKERICFIGHTHQPLLYEWAEPGKSGFYQTGEIFNLDADKRYIINVGSVGQPRDNNPMACLYFYDSKHLTVSVKRLPYNVQASQDKMSKAGIPPQLVMRLAMGV